MFVHICTLMLPLALKKIHAQDLIDKTSFQQLTMRFYF